MEAVLVSAATGALKPILGKLATLVGDEYKRFKSVHGEIKSLTCELAAMDAFLQEMSEEEDPDVQDKVWMNEVRELSYDMEDSIDDFIQRVDDKEAKPDGFTEKIKHSLGKLKARHWIGNNIEDLKKQIVAVGERNLRYKTRQAFSNTKNATVDPRALAIFKHASELVGIDEPKAEIIKLLTKDDGCATLQEQPKVVSIVGSGGMGKTTLANQVFRSLKGAFQCRAFLSVSRNPDVMNILRIILSEVSGQAYAETEAGSIQQLIGKINNYLLKKRYFIVVDDIWEVKTWDIIKCAFYTKTYGSIIIATTRMNDVAHACRSSFSGHIYNIRHLNTLHSRQLFCRRLFNSEEDCPLHLKTVSSEILKKCAGLPLAIIAISGLLANKEFTVDQWNQVKNTIGRALERNPSVEGMVKILSLSYFDLPPHLKTCLLYLSTLPEDSIINRTGLVRKWVAERFVNKEGRYTEQEVGDMCFNELVNRSLIQPVGTDKYNEVTSCRVHDIILDFIRSKAIEENFVTLVGVPYIITGTQRKARRLSLQAGTQGCSIVPKSLILSHVRSLIVLQNSWEIIPLGKLRHLRVLEMKGCDQLRNHHLTNIGRLIHLRYLNLTDTGVSELPEQIGHLRCLETLDIRATGVSTLPATIGNLTNLVHLLIDCGVLFSGGIVKMQALEVLSWVIVFEQPLCFLQELGQLKNLRKLYLDFDHHSFSGVTRECEKAVASSLHQLHTDNSLSLYISNDDSFLMESWFPAPLSLQRLVTDSSAVPRVPKWMGSLVNLQELRLEVIGGSQQDLCILGGLPSLLILYLEGTRKSENGLIVSGGIGFQCLREFHYVRYGVMDLMFAAGSMPRLEKLKVQFEEDEDEPLTFDFGIENLPPLITYTPYIRRIS